MTPWLGVVVPTLTAALILLGPGLVLGLCLRFRGPLLLGMAAPFSIALVGSSAVIAAVIDVGFTPLVPLAGTAIAVVGVLSARLLVSRLRSSGESPLLLSPVSSTSAAFTGPGMTAVAASAVIASLASALVAFGAISSPELLSQTYDGVFHLNAVAWILQGGDASSFHLYRMTHPGEDVEFYPAAWHAIVALVVQTTGVSVPVATNAAWIASVGAISGLGTALLVGAVLPLARHRALTTVVAVLSTSATAAAPYVLLRWGVLYPTGLAYALLPAGLALTVLAFRKQHARTFWSSSSLLGVWLLACAFAHPRSLVSYALLVLPLLIGVIVRWAITGLRDRTTRTRTLWVLAGAAVAAVAIGTAGVVGVLKYFGAAERPISDRLNGGPATAHQDLLTSALQALLITPPSGVGESTLPATVLLIVAVIAGAVFAALRPATRWLVVAYVLVIVLYAAAAGSNTDAAKLATGLWYKDKFRLFALLGVIAPVFIAIAAERIALLSDRVRTTAPVIARFAPAAVSLIVLGSSWFGPTLTSMTTVMPTDWRVAEQKEGRLLDSGAEELLERLPSLTAPEDVVVGNPWNGSALTWAVGDRQSLFPHLAGEWDADRLIIAERLDLAASDPEVCAALDRLGAHYLFSSDGLLWGGDPAAALYQGIDRAPSAAGFDLVAEEGSARLYRIGACD